MSQYTDKEINLAKRIFEATMLVSNRTTTRKAKIFAKKHDIPFTAEMPDVICLETARSLLKYYEEELDKTIRKAMEQM